MSSAGEADLASQWMGRWMESLQPREVSEPLKGASLNANLGDWTRLLTAAVVRSCETLGWQAAAKGHELDLLPQAGQEYLGIDVMAFPAADADNHSRQQWPFPVAAFELENSRQDDRVAYSLWKVICVRSVLRVVFAYRSDWDQARALVRSLKQQVIDGFTIEQRQTLDDQTLVVTGSRGEGETFPHGYFKVWRLNLNIGDFERFTGWG